MAEEIEGGVATATDGTGESQASGQSIEQPEAYTPEELRESFRQVVREENADFWNEMRRTVMPMQTQLAAMAPKIEALLPQIAEVQGDAAATRQLVIDVLSGESLDADQLQAIKDAKKLDEQQRETARRQREDANRQQEIAEAKKGQLTPGQLRQIRFEDTWAIVDDDLDQRAKGLGFRDFKSIADDVKAGAGKEIPAAWMIAGDEFGLKRWKREAVKAMVAMAAARDAEGNAPMDVPSLRGGGGQSAQKIWEAYGEGERAWSVQVQAAGKELGYI